MDEKEPAWHREAIDANVVRTLHDLQQIAILARFYLAGGTGLALYLGHRRSVDLDFFLGEDFNEDSVLQKLQRIEGFALVAKEPGTIYANIRQTKVSFITHAYPALFPFLLFLGTNVADPRDIACMKISAIASRGTKRDFVDLYVLSQHLTAGAVIRAGERLRNDKFLDALLATLADGPIDKILDEPLDFKGCEPTHTEFG
jgi:predicted nucleotidyltransferase component of viral defense system